MVENSPSFDMSTNSNGNKNITYEEAVASILPGNTAIIREMNMKSSASPDIQRPQSPW